MPQTGYIGLPTRWYIRSFFHVQQALFSISVWGNNAMRGKLNVVGTVTLGANTTTTTLNDPRIGAESCIVFMPTTATAAAEMDNLFVTARGDQTCTLNHSNTADVDKILDYAVWG